MRIAILGWGSLLWEQNPKFDQWHDQPWQYDGPQLKLEFSRISGKSRRGALTLVIDAVNGSRSVVAYCLSKRSSCDDAVKDLKCREGTTLQNIGCIAAQDNHTTMPQKIILEWAKSKSIHAVIWTNLESNFQKVCGQSFSIAAAITHLKNLTPDAQQKAIQHIRCAPDFVQTLLRTALQEDSWFKEFPETPCK